MPDWAEDPIYDGEPIFMILAEMEAYRETMLAEEFDVDMLDRLLGRCDLCGELPVKREQLQIDGGLALCSGCCTRGEDP